jgi:ribonuclease HI
MRRTKIDKSLLTKEEIDFRQGFAFQCFFDGSLSQGKIGFGGCVIDNDSRREIYNFSETIRMKGGSVNVAEYMALIRVLEALEAGCEGKNILIMGDSLLVVNQLKRIWNINGGAYREFAIKARDILKNSKNKITLMWIPREKNQRADELSKTH